MRYQDELADLGIDTYEKSEEFKENLKELRKSVTRERTAERRLSNYGRKKVLYRRKAKKTPSVEGV